MVNIEGDVVSLRGSADINGVKISFKKVIFNHTKGNITVIFEPDTQVIEDIEEFTRLATVEVEKACNFLKRRRGKEKELILDLDKNFLQYRSIKCENGRGFAVFEPIYMWA